MYLPRRFYIAATAIILIFILGYILSPFFIVGKILLCVFVTLLITDFVLLYYKRGVTGYRSCSDRFSNGDQNEVEIRLENLYPYTVHLDVVDEIPVIFQRRDVDFKLNLPKGVGKSIIYNLCPVKRGTYGFGLVRVFMRTPIGFIMRRLSLGEATDVKVYPSYQKLHKYELLALGRNLQEFGIKKIRKIGNNTDFEQIKDYVKGDDYRTINWKASARRHQLMVNVYQDERSQPIYNVIDKGRVMQQAFHGMTLLDYAINASLALSHIALKKEDKAGLLTFEAQFDTFVPAEKHHGYIRNILEALYAQETSFGESDYSSLCILLNHYVNKRSLVVLYTNFLDINSLNRQLPYLIQINSHHKLLVVFFEDEQINEYVDQKSENVEDIYKHVIAEQFVLDKQLIVSTLRQNGIMSILTTPKNLSVDVINKYIEIKSRQLI